MVKSALGVLRIGAPDIVTVNEQFALGLGIPPGICPKGCRFDDLAPEENVRESKSSSNDAAIPEKPFDFSGSCAGGHIKVLGIAIEKQVAHTTADQIGLKPALRQAPNDLVSVGIDQFRGDIHLCEMINTTAGWLAMERKLARPTAQAKKRP